MLSTSAAFGSPLPPARSRRRVSLSSSWRAATRSEAASTEVAVGPEWKRYAITGQVLLGTELRLRVACPNRDKAAAIGLDATQITDTLSNGFGQQLVGTIYGDRTQYRVLLELDPKYVDVICQRWQMLAGKKATLDGDGRTFEQIAEERQKAAV